jgi:hypothetical protein
VIQSHEELDVYRMAFAGAMRVFELSKGLPREERYSLVDQIGKLVNMIATPEPWLMLRRTH